MFRKLSLKYSLNKALFPEGLALVVVPGYLEDHPMTCKWLITIVSVRPLSRVIPLPNALFMAYKLG